MLWVWKEVCDRLLQMDVFKESLCRGGAVFLQLVSQNWRGVVVPVPWQGLGSGDRCVLK